VAILAACLLSAVFVAAAGARYAGDGVKGSAGKGVSDAYIVQLEDPPVAAYEGGIAGLAATAPAPGQKIDRNSDAVRQYVAYLESKQAEAANSVGATRFYSYAYAYNGFAAVLSKAQVTALEKLGNVVSVQRDQLAKLETDNTPTFLGLTASGGIWSQLGGQSKAGDGVVVGIIDTGIWPEHPSFSGSGFGPPPATWHGTCQSGEQFAQSDCSNKLVGARYYLSGFGHFGVVKDDYKSARDADGHGSHTGSTAVGNGGVAASILGNSLGTISGMAPAARIAAYKVCWNGEAGGCPNTDSVAAINDAIADGVDVLNFSISGTQTNYLDPVEVAFLMARRAGVFVATSAGNSGPGASTVAHISPWLMSVAASTQNRSFVGTATLGNNQSYKGVTLTGGLASSPLVDSVAGGSELCFVGALSPAVVSGKVVLCRRGVSARVDKSLAVKQAGGVGMILYNANDAQSLNTDNHWLPSLHVNFTQGTAIKAYIASAGAGAKAALSGGQKEFGGGNTMADFSSRGPTVAGSQDVVKPDITAPGVNILAANSPTAFLGASGQLFQAIGGTSMSSPHIAGLGALVADLHPDWTPAMIQSALMTSARQNVALEDGSTPAGPFAFGAGHAAPTVRPTRVSSTRRTSTSTGRSSGARVSAPSASVRRRHR
jgi:subtilisin family serine protease